MTKGNDLYKFINMLEAAKIEYTYETNDEGSRSSVTIEAKDGPNNLGYANFLTEFTFDESGNLLKVGIWE